MVRVNGVLPAVPRKTVLARSMENEAPRIGRPMLPVKVRGIEMMMNQSRLSVLSGDEIRKMPASDVVSIILADGMQFSASQIRAFNAAQSAEIVLQVLSRPAQLAKIHGVFEKSGSKGVTYMDVWQELMSDDKTRKDPRQFDELFLLLDAFHGLSQAQREAAVGVISIRYSKAQASGFARWVMPELTKMSYYVHTWINQSKHIPADTWNVCGLTQYQPDLKRNLVRDRQGDLETGEWEGLFETFDERNQRRAEQLAHRW